MPFLTPRRAARIAALAVAAAGLLAAPAFAGDVRVGFFDADTLLIEADGTDNHIQLDQFTSDGSTRIRVHDATRTSTFTLGASCTPTAQTWVVSCAVPAVMWINLFEGDDVLDGSATFPEPGSAVVSTPMVIHGYEGRDVLHGGAGDDLVYGDWDDDTLYGEDGDDLIEGATGDDRLAGGTGNDRLIGHAGADTLDGGAGADVLDGREGPDILDGGTGADYLRGGVDNDTLRGGDGRDTLVGDEGADVLHGGLDDDELNGGEGADELHGDGGSDILIGGDGPDFLEGDTASQPKGDDWLYGGSGDDSLDSYDGIEDGFVECGDGDDEAVGDSELDFFTDCETIGAEIHGTPVVTGTFLVGQTVSLAPLKISGTLVTTTFRWHSCSATACTTLQESATPSLVIPASAAGHQLWVEVTAENSASKMQRESVRVGPVASEPDVIVPPAVVPDTPGAGETRTPAPIIPPAVLQPAGAFGKASKPKLAGLRITLGQPVSCRADGAAACKVAISATAKDGKWTVTVATGTLTLAAGKTGSPRIALNQTGRKLLRKRGRLALTATIRVRQSGSAAAEKRRTFTVKR